MNKPNLKPTRDGVRALGDYFDWQLELLDRSGVELARAMGEIGYELSPNRITDLRHGRRPSGMVLNEAYAYKRLGWFKFGDRPLECDDMAAVLCEEIVPPMGRAPHYGIIDSSIIRGAKTRTVVKNATAAKLIQAQITDVEEIAKKTGIPLQRMREILEGEEPTAPEWMRLAVHLPDGFGSRYLRCFE